MRQVTVEAVRELQQQVGLEVAAHNHLCPFDILDNDPYKYFHAFAYRTCSIPDIGLRACVIKPPVVSLCVLFCVSQVGVFGVLYSGVYTLLRHIVRHRVKARHRTLFIFMMYIYTYIVYVHIHLDSSSPIMIARLVSASRER
jgi:hypothetical protein